MMWLIAIVLMLVSTSATQAQGGDWDVEGVQGRVGFYVNSGLGEPLSLQLGEIKPDELKGAIAMRIYANGQRLGLHMGREIDADTAIILPDCTDTVTVVVLRGKDFDSELEAIDTGVIELVPRPIGSSLNNAVITRVGGRPQIVISGIQLLGATAKSDASVSIQITQSAVRDTSEALVQLKPALQPERVVGPGQTTYSLDVATISKNGKPYSSKITGSLEITFTVSRTVCGRNVRKTLTKVIVCSDR